MKKVVFSLIIAGITGFECQGSAQRRTIVTNFIPGEENIAKIVEGYLIGSEGPLEAWAETYYAYREHTPPKAEKVVIYKPSDNSKVSFYADNITLIAFTPKQDQLIIRHGSQAVDIDGTLYPYPKMTLLSVQDGLSVNDSSAFWKSCEKRIKESGVERDQLFPESHQLAEFTRDATNEFLKSANRKLDVKRTKLRRCPVLLQSLYRCLQNHVGH